jgi:hypothetical protein
VGLLREIKETVTGIGWNYNLFSAEIARRRMDALELLGRKSRL